MTTDVDGDELGRLLAVSGGFLAFAVWNLVFRLAATCSRRGVLIKDGLPMPVEHLAGLAQLPVHVIERALELLASPEIGLMERVPLHEATVPPKVLEPLPRKPKIKPLLQCPVCAADLTEYYQLESPQGESTQAAAAERMTGTTGSLNQCERSESEAAVPTSATRPMTSMSLRSHRFEEPVPAAACSRIRENSGAELPGTQILANSATVKGPADECGTDTKPRPTWLKEVMISRAFGPEIEDVRQLFLRGEITREEVYHFLDTHYYERDDLEDEDWVWDEDYWQEDLLLEMDLPPPQTRNW